MVIENRQYIHNLIILDESGSMQSIKETIIQGFNEIVQTMKGIEKKFPEQEHFITLVAFNGLDITTILDGQPLASLSEIDGNKYQPNAATPLFDAMGFSLCRLKEKLKKIKDHHVLVTILTDGEENDSKEYTGAAIKKLVEALKSQGWTFTYIGADHDVEKFAFSISINNTMVFDKNEAGMKNMFVKEAKARSTYSMKIRNGEILGEGFYGEG